MNKKVLLVEDDLQMQSLIVDYLKDYGFIVTAFDNPKDVLEDFKLNSDYSIIILDLMLPFMDGFDLFNKLKEIKNIPIIISTARGDIGNKIHGFELGADDYLAKPYEPRELVLRIESILKRNSTKSFKIGDFTIDKDNRTVLIDDYAIDFTKIEFEIFIYLIENKNKISSREQILNATSLDFNTKNRTIDMHISNIRAKIGDDSKNPKYIKSVWGIGYKFVG
ncbi:response regulator transcription factor [Aliarcobacter cryaerophilus]|uniref:Phosphate regulon transcriptional regulatory protein PhoB n=2 Tax=unclassified Arcobacter TaxID=2593671 RepID=A0AA96DD16_9BACT|nr:response regulator transcription factor [Aliarcobacter cryaerophilus]NCB11799.1 response regulator transcription factor [Erysipelotrichia bacterium]OQA75090.1 MAG: Transcriptional regulatory protein SrrA [Candidatus Dependentiae bacterium ADurb.Bin246]WNL12470.1 response regulator transcription factor [Arcobacter sp. AZ-2023]WPD08957.1 response regulator transcription factor [Arcobacter sp. DSM 115954]MCT7467827.1 response regulator transcription factor [Aliarcobacter cryaerophilus]